MKTEADEARPTAPDQLIARAQEHLRLAAQGEAVALIQRADPATMSVKALDRALPILLTAESVHAGEFEAVRLLETISSRRDDQASRGILEAHRAVTHEDDPAERARLAAAALERLDEQAPISRHRALAALLTAKLDLGDGLDEELLERMAQQETSLELIAPVDSALAHRGFYAYQVGDLDGSHAALRALARQAHREGQPLMARIFLSHLATVDIYAGRLDAARRGLDAAAAVAGGAPGMLPVEARARGLLAVRTDDADALQAILLEPALYGSTTCAGLARATLIGLSAAIREDWQEAYVQLTRSSELADASGLRDPGRRLWIDIDLARAAIEIGHVAQALTIADRLEAVAGGTRPLLTGAADRIRGVAERSSERLEASAAVLAGAGHPDQQALSLLELGRALVEDGCTEKAQAALERARVIVRRTGDVAIARLVDNALQSTSFDARLVLLTAREQKVARAAAAGATNRQIAAAGYTSVRTVESQLSSVYRKLGVRSRAQLVALLSGEQPRRA